MAQLSLQVDQIKESPREFQLQSDESWWRHAREVLHEPGVALRAPFCLSFRAHRLGFRLLLQGELRGAIELCCVRCLDPHPCELRQPMQLLLEPVSPQGRPTEGGIELDSDDIEVGHYWGLTLDFEPVVLEILALAWPVQPCCRETCPGLCTTCGRKRDGEACTCPSDATLRPFAGLREQLEEAAAAGRAAKQKE